MRVFTFSFIRFPRGLGAEISFYTSSLITTRGCEPGVASMAPRQQAKILNFRFRPHRPLPPNTMLNTTRAEKYFSSTSVS
jgi:hypothetical protein